MISIKEFNQFKLNNPIAIKGGTCPCRTISIGGSHVGKGDSISEDGDVTWDPISASDPSGPMSDDYTIVST